jgi:hypothetical protein
MARSSHKFRRLLNLGKRKTTIGVKPPKHPDRHIHYDKNHIDMEGLAEIFLCSIPKIKEAREMGIIKSVNEPSKRYIFDKEEAIEALSKFVKDGYLELRPRKKRPGKKKGTKNKPKSKKKDTK